MRTAIVLADWVWFLAALPEVTDTGIDLLVVFLLAFTGPAIGLAWVVYSVLVGRVFREPGWRWAWLSVPLAGIAPVLLLGTGWGLIARVWLCEGELREYAVAVQHGQRDTPRRVGLFQVGSARGDDNVAVLMTATSFLHCFGLAYRPNTPPDWTDRQHRHLYGPWYRFQNDY